MQNIFLIFAFLNKSVDTAFFVILLYIPVSDKPSDTWMWLHQKCRWCQLWWGGSSGQESREDCSQETRSACTNRPVRNPNTFNNGKSKVLALWGSMPQQDNTFQGLRNNSMWFCTSSFSATETVVSLYAKQTSLVCYAVWNCKLQSNFADVFTELSYFKTLPT